MSNRINFVSVDERTLTLPDKIGLTLIGREASTPVRMLRELVAITAAPAMLEDGTLVGTRHGYDPVTCTFYNSPPSLTIPERPLRAEAEAALKLLRDELATFLWAGPDAPVVTTTSGTVVMDTARPAGLNELAALSALLTALQRPVLDIVPGFVIGAARGSGSGSGKGKFLRAVAMIATGRAPYIVGHDPDPEEQEKRIVTGLLRGEPFTMFDNWNGMRIKSPAMATAITEPGGRLRKLGASKDYPVPRTFLGITGNDVRPVEDLVSRFIVALMDARTPDPEGRKFAGRYAGDVLMRMAERRAEMLTAALTVLRWACQAQDKDAAAYAALLRRQETLEDGSSRLADPVASRFPAWDRAVRFPIMALGCADPVTQHREARRSIPIGSTSSRFSPRGGASTVTITSARPA